MRLFLLSMILLGYAITSLAQPETPYTTVSVTNTCNGMVVTRDGYPPSGDIWWWHTAPGSTFTGFGSGPSITITASTPLYLRARSNFQWSTESFFVGYITVLPPPIPGTPNQPNVTNNTCGPQTVTINGTPPSGVTWYWQDTSDGVSTTNASTSTQVTQAGTRNVYLRAYSSEGCWSASSAMVTVTVVSPPQTPYATLAESGGPCGPKTVSISGTPPLGENWFWQGNNPEAKVTNSYLNPPVTVTGTYYLRAYSYSKNCWSTYSQSIYVIVNPLPELFTVSGGGASCGSVEASISLSGSQVGTNYQLRRNGINLGSPTPGTGGPLLWSNQTIAGTYSVYATNISTGCSSHMTGEATVSIYSLPNQFAVTGGGNICSGSQTSVGLTSSQVGVSYQLKFNGTNYLSPISGSGSSLTFSGLVTQGTYAIEATNGTTGCQQLMSGVASIVVNPTPAPPSISGGSRFGAGPLILSASGALDGTYTWFNSTNGIVKENDANYVTPTFSNSANNAFYAVITSNQGCPSSKTWINISIEALPVVTSSSSRVSMGSSVTLTADAGYSSYEWRNQDDVIVSTNQSFVTQKSGTYIVRVTKTNTSGVGSSLEKVIYSQLSEVNQNYVVTDEILTSGITQPATIETLSIDKRNQTVQYFDGLGRLNQIISTQSSPGNKDLIQPVLYDQFGRESIKYLPFTTNQFNGWFRDSPLTDQSLFYSGGANKTAEDLKPYSKTIFEASPLNRVVEQGSPGSAWQPEEGRALKNYYEINSSTDVYYFLFASGSLVRQGYYQAGELLKLRRQDENQNEVIEFTDKEGRVVCKKVQYAISISGEKLFASTYYIYDDIGNLVLVLPPEAIKNIGN